MLYLIMNNRLKAKLRRKYKNDFKVNHIRNQIKCMCSKTLF